MTALGIYGIFVAGAIGLGWLFDRIEQRNARRDIIRRMKERAHRDD